MVYVTHDQVEAMTLADRIAIMRNGSIQQLGTPSEIYNYPANLYVAGFIGSPSMNFLSGELNQGIFSFGDVTIALNDYHYATDARSGNAILGVRPEHVVLGDAIQEHHFSTELEVELFEPMGSDTQVWAHLGNQSFRIRVDGQMNVSNGDKLKIGIDTQRCSLFDKNTELPL